MPTMRPSVLTRFRQAVVRLAPGALVFGALAGALGAGVLGAALGLGVGAGGVALPGAAGLGSPGAVPAPRGGWRLG